MDDEMLRNARAAIVDAALAWFTEVNLREDRMFSPAEEKLRVAVNMFRKTRSISGQIDVSEIRQGLKKAQE